MTLKKYITIAVLIGVVSIAMLATGCAEPAKPKFGTGDVVTLWDGTSAQVIYARQSPLGHDIVYDVRLTGGMVTQVKESQLSR